MAGTMHRLRVGKVIGVKEQWQGCQELEVQLEGQGCLALNYPPLTGEVKPGDAVLLNVVAVELQLGTGGYHFVVANLSAPEAEAQPSGHIMKLRYTPHQLNVLSVEAPESPYREAFEASEGLQGMPVVIGILHSMLAPAAGGFKATVGMESKVVYVMTDSSALPLALSKLVSRLKAKGLVDATITVGQAFGGDYEAVNLFTGLLAAKVVANADAVIVTPGPGHLGTGTKFGFSGIEMGFAIDVTNALGGKPIFIPRLSFADERTRHHGISHHTVTILNVVAQTKATVCFPSAISYQPSAISHQLSARHEAVFEDGKAGIELLNRLGIPLSSMGRRFEDDPLFFLAAAAAGVYAAKRLSKAMP